MKAIYKILTFSVLAAFLFSITNATGNQTGSTENVKKEYAKPVKMLTGEKINWQVLSGGGTEGSSDSYRLQGTVGQAAIGKSNSTNYHVYHGYWQMFGGTGGCCIGIRGNANNDPLENINISDITYLVAYCFGGGVAPACIDEGNANGDELNNINISDITYLVAYCFGGGEAPPACP